MDMRAEKTNMPSRAKALTKPAATGMSEARDDAHRAWLGVRHGRHVSHGGIHNGIDLAFVIPNTRSTQCRVTRGILA